MVQELSPSLPPQVALVSGGLKLGGATTFLCNFGGELVRRGIRTEVLSLEKENPLSDDFKRLNVPVFWQDDRHLIFEDRIRAVWQELRRFRPTVVVSCLGAISFEVLRYLPAGVSRVGMVQSHDPGVYAMVRRYAAHLDLMAGVSKVVKETLEAMPEFEHMPVRYLPYGVPMPEKAAPSSPDSGASLRILYLGRLEQEQKRVRLFPQILEQLKSSGIPFHWTIAGEGPEKSFLQSAMQSASRKQTVRFPGAILYQDVPQLLAAHNVFLLASDYEGLPLSLLEAMGYGLVPVVSDLASGIREVVDETSGKRVAPDNLPAYAEAIIWLHEHRDEMSRLSQNAQARVRREFSVGAMTDRWLEALPPPPKASVDWPHQRSISAPLGSSRKLQFSPPARMLRRWLIRFRS
jgi:glycosyltransferase involved in cell wall biosynthesis